MIYFPVLQTRPVVHEVLITVFVTGTTPVTLILLVNATLHRSPHQRRPTLDLPEALTKNAHAQAWRNGVVVADPPLLLDAQDVPRGTRSVRQEGRAVLLGSDGESGVVGRDVGVRDPCILPGPFPVPLSNCLKTGQITRYKNRTDHPSATKR